MSDSDVPAESNPRKPRQNVLLSAEISGFGDGPPTKHRVRDLSTTGVRVDHASSLKVGATLLVSVGALEEVGATVIWVKGDSAGLKFAEIIDPDAARSRAIVQPSQKPVKMQNAADRLGNSVGGAEKGIGAGWTARVSDPHRKRRTRYR